MPIWLAVLAGGGLGSLARHGVNLVFTHWSERPVPYATATVNLVGAVAIGLLAGLLAAGRLHMSVPARTFVFVGVLGGFTTFSSFMLDSLTLGHGGSPGLAAANVVGQMAAGLALVWAGYYLGVR